MLCSCRVNGGDEGERTSVRGGMPCTSANDFADEGCSDSESGSEFDDNDEGVVWARSGVEAEDYIRRRTIWKNVIKVAGQMFSLADSFIYTMWKYAIVNKFDYYFVRKCR